MKVYSLGFTVHDLGILCRWSVGIIVFVGRAIILIMEASFEEAQLQKLKQTHGLTHSRTSVTFSNSIAPYSFYDCL